MYLALATRPEMAKIPGSDFWKVVEWKELGPAKDVEDAKNRYGGSPVLAEMPK